MSFTTEHKKKIRSAWRILITNASYLDLFGDLEQNNELNKICTLLTSDKEIKKYLDKEDVVELIRHWIAFEVGTSKGWNINKKIIDTLDHKQQSNGIDYLIKNIEQTPYDCRSFFPINTSIPEEIEEINITNDVKIISKEQLNKSFPTSEGDDSPLARLMMSGSYAPDANYYIMIHTKGYPGPYGNGQAIKTANKKLREILFLLGISKHAQIHSYKKPGGWPYCFYISEMDKNERKQISISQSTVHGLINFEFKDGIWEPSEILLPETADVSIPTILGMSLEAPEKGHPRYAEAIEETFRRSTEWLRNYLKTTLSRRIRLSRAIEWGFMGEVNQDEEAGFIQTCIALEALLGEETKIESNRLFDRAAYMLGKSQKDREDIFKNFKNIYQLRSAVVHGKKEKITSKEKSLMKDAEYLLRRILWNEIHSIINKASS